MTEFISPRFIRKAFPGGSVVKNLPVSAGDIEDEASVSGLGRPPEWGNGDTLQYYCLENPMDRGTWWATVHGVAELNTTLWLSTHTHIHRGLQELEWGGLLEFYFCQLQTCLPRAFSVCLCRDWTLCCCSCRPSTPPEGSPGWRVRPSVLQEMGGTGI